jgi:hypothetical protein
MIISYIEKQRLVGTLPPARLLLTYETKAEIPSSQLLLNPVRVFLTVD